MLRSKRACKLYSFVRFASFGFNGCCHTEIVLGWILKVCVVVSFAFNIANTVPSSYSISSFHSLCTFAFFFFPLFSIVECFSFLSPNCDRTRTVYCQPEYTHKWTCAIYEKKKTNSALMQRRMKMSSSVNAKVWQSTAFFSLCWFWLYFRYTCSLLLLFHSIPLNIICIPIWRAKNVMPNGLGGI